MGFDFSVVLLYCATSVIIIAIALWLGKFLRPHLPNADKSSIYESGEKTIGSGWFNFNPRFYLMALVFLIFDVEIALTFPAAIVLKDWVEQGRGWTALLEITVFLAILVAALAYVWGKGALGWIRDIRGPEDRA